MKNKKELNYYTYELDMVFLNILSLIIFGAVSIMVWLIVKNDPLMIQDNPGPLLIYMILWLMLHEILHGIGFAIFKEVNKKNIVFGMALEKGVFYCMCKQKISKKVILTSLLFPVTIIGLITLIIGIMIHSYYLVVLSILNIAGAVGDLVMTVFFLKADNDIIYLDLDDCTSFTVLSTKDISNIKVKGIKLRESGIYNEKMESHNKKRITISKKSYVTLGIILILSLIMMWIER